MFRTMIKRAKIPSGLTLPHWTRHQVRPLAALRRRNMSRDELEPRRPFGSPWRDLGPRMDRMAEMMDRFENELFGGTDTLMSSNTKSAMSIAMDVKEEANRYVITADLPGMTKSDVKIEVIPERILSISGERKEERQEEKDSYYRSERRFGSFYRGFSLPPNADEASITAKAENGVLEVSIPKSEAKSGARVIDIQ